MVENDNAVPLDPECFRRDPELTCLTVANTGSIKNLGFSLD